MRGGGAAGFCPPRARRVGLGSALRPGQPAEERARGAGLSAGTPGQSSRPQRCCLHGSVGLMQPPGHPVLPRLCQPCTAPDGMQIPQGGSVQSLPDQHSLPSLTEKHLRCRIPFQCFTRYRICESNTKKIRLRRQIQWRGM